MAAELTSNAYGKSQVRLVAVRRGAQRHELADLTVDVRFTGDYESAYRDGDNANVYPTDSMKNSVYALARRHGVGEIERFAASLAEHYLSRPTPPAGVEVTIRERPWSRIEIEGRPHGHAFVAGGGERRVARATRDAGGERCEAGVEGLVVLRTTGSAFAGFPRDEYTTLAETDDRILATAIDATWRYGEPLERYDVAYAAARRTLLATFAEHASLSVQHTLHALGEAVLDGVPEIAAIHLRLPNLHHWRVDLAPFALDNPDQIYVATSEPFGVIEGTLRRG
jgi:urate oxidase